MAQGEEKVLEAGGGGQNLNLSLKSQTLNPEIHSWSFYYLSQFHKKRTALEKLGSLPEVIGGWGTLSRVSQ